MLLITHIIIASASILFTGYTAFFPSLTKLKISYGLVLATIATGTWLIIVSSTPILPVCLTGLGYVAIIISILVAAHLRLAKAKLVQSNN